jgi:hypothetical protein
MQPTIAQQNENCFHLLKSLRDSQKVDFGNLVHELDQGNGFAPFWPIFSEMERIFFVNTEDIYLYLTILSERPQIARTFEYEDTVAAPPPTEVAIEDLNYDIEHIIQSPRIYSAGVKELEEMLRKLSGETLEGLLKMMELNESENVLVPVSNLHNPLTVYKLSSDYFLTMVLDAYHEARDHEMRRNGI